MPNYSIEQLVALKESDLVVVPEFKWNEIEKVPAGTNAYQEGGAPTWRRRSSHHTKRPVVMPKAAIPFSQRALFDGGKSKEHDSAVADLEDADEEDDEYAARYLLKSKNKAKKAETTTEDGQPVVNLKYAAALAASMKMSEAPAEEPVAESEDAAAAGEEDGWVSVSHQGKPKRNRAKGGSFSRWR